VLHDFVIGARFIFSSESLYAQLHSVRNSFESYFVLYLDHQHFM